MPNSNLNPKIKLKEPICIYEDGTWCFLEDFNPSKDIKPFTVTSYVDLSKFSNMDKHILSIYKKEI